MAQQPTNGKVCQVRGARELLVCDLKADAVWDLPADAARKADENMSKSPGACVRNQTQVCCQIPNQIVTCDGKPVVQQLGITGRKCPNRRPQPREHVAFRTCFSAYQEIGLLCQERRCTECVSRHQPKQVCLFPVRCNKEMPSGPLHQQTETICGGILLDYHGVCRVLAMNGKSKHLVYRGGG